MLFQYVFFYVLVYLKTSIARLISTLHLHETGKNTAPPYVKKLLLYEYILNKILFTFWLIYEVKNFFL